MAIAASGIYGLTLEKFLIVTVAVAQSIEAETNKGMLVLDAYTPNFDTDAFRSVIVNEATGTGYTAGGIALTTTDITPASPAAGTLKIDHDDPSWANSTIANAMALIEYLNVGTPATDPLWCLLDFVTAVSTSAGTLLVSIAAAGAINIDHTP